MAASSFAAEDLVWVLVIVFLIVVIAAVAMRVFR